MDTAARFCGKLKHSMPCFTHRRRWWHSLGWLSPKLSREEVLHAFFSLVVDRWSVEMQKPGFSNHLPTRISGFPFIGRESGTCLPPSSKERNAGVWTAELTERQSGPQRTASPEECPSAGQSRSSALLTLLTRPAACIQPLRKARTSLGLSGSKPKLVCRPRWSLTGWGEAGHCTHRPNYETKPVLRSGTIKYENSPAPKIISFPRVLRIRTALAERGRYSQNGFCASWVR